MGKEAVRESEERWNKYWPLVVDGTLPEETREQTIKECWELSLNSICKLKPERKLIKVLFSITFSQ